MHEIFEDIQKGKATFKNEKNKQEVKRNLTSSFFMIFMGK